MKRKKMHLVRMSFKHPVLATLGVARSYNNNLMTDYGTVINSSEKQVRIDTKGNRELRLVKKIIK